VLDEARTERTLVWASAGLQVRCAAIEYHRFPVTEWTVYFKNIGTNDTPILSDLAPLDSQFGGPGARRFVLHHNRGDDCSPESYQPHELPLSEKRLHKFAPVGGRPSHTGFPYFNLAWRKGA